MSDIVIGWVVIPGFLLSVAGSVATALWTFYSTRDLKHVESRLRRDEESFRIAHSPRVTSAIDFWIAIRAYERRWVELLRPIKEVRTPAGATPADWDRLSREQDRQLWRDLEASWNEMRLARDRAEVLLPSAAFNPMDALFTAYGNAHRVQWAMQLPGATRESLENLAKDRDGKLAEASRLHVPALIAAKALLGASEGA